MFCICQEDQHSTPEFFECSNPNCGQTVHPKCHNINPRLFPYFECPSCILKYSDPSYQVMKVLIPATYLTPSSNLDFNLSSFDYQLLINNENPNFYITIRCISFHNDPYTVHYDTWPRKGILTLNQSKLKFSDLVDSHNRRVSFNRILKRQEANEGKNVLDIDTEIQDGEHYYFGVFLVKKHSFESLKVIIEEGCRLTPEESKQFIQKTINSKKCQKSTTVSLMDDNGQLLETPVRGKGCKHVTCFSLENFLRNQEMSSVKRWNCPICKNRCYHLVVDEYFLKIISKYQGKKLQKYNVTFYKNGAFEVAAGITRGNSTTDAIQIDDSEGLDETSYLGKALSTIKDTMKICMGPDLGLSVLTVPQTRDIERMCAEIGKNETVTIKEIHQVILDLYDPLALRRNDLCMEIEENNGPEIEETRQEQIRVFFTAFLNITESVLTDVPNIKQVLIELEDHEDKFMNKYSLELSILYTMKYIMERFTKLRINRNYILENLKGKIMLTQGQQELLKLHFDWKNFYKGKVNKPSFKFDHLASNKSKDDYEEFPLLLIKEVGSERFNWAVKQVLCERKKLWKIIWDPSERWYNVEFSKHAKKICKTPLQDPFAGMLDNDVDRVMEELMYLKECWRYEIKTGNGSQIKVLAPFIEVEIEDFFRNAYLDEKYTQKLKKEVRFHSFRKDGNTNMKKFAQEFELDLM